MRRAVVSLLVLALAAVAHAGQSAPSGAWMTAFDFDGDGKPDRIGVVFTGGAHCCYRVSMRLTSSGRTIDLPFEIDGGYPAGLDLSQPNRFDVSRTAAGPELVMQIATYDGVPQPLPPAWQRAFGVRSHRIAVSFPRGRMTVRNLPEATRSP